MAAEMDVAARERLLEALANGATIAAAARAAGYARQHAHRLLSDPAFAAKLAKRRAQLAGVPEPDDVQAARKFLRSVVDGEVEDEASTLAVRVNAAKALIAAHAMRVKASPKLAPAPSTAPPLKLVDGKAAAADWLGKQA